MRADDRVELRGDIPRELADVLDAASMAANQSRISLVIDVLHEWALRKHREATLVLRVAPRYPAQQECCRKADGCCQEGRG